ncbi:MAG: TPM domain-containing protein [Bacteroidota bacterium]
MTAKDFFSEEEKAAIRMSIAAAELHTSGEIRVHVEDNGGTDVVKKAKKVFDREGMHKTKDRNGVLFFIGAKDHTFAIYGDKGIHERVHQEFWDGIKDELMGYFADKKFAQGLCVAVEKTGEKLKEFFPREKSDKDELSNEISY